MESCYFGEVSPAIESLLTWQHVSDVVTAMAYISVPLQLIYFTRMSPIVPDKWAFVYFGTYASLCGATFLTNLWRYSEKSRTAAFVITAVRVSTILISWFTVWTIRYVVPYLLSLQKRVLFLNNRVESMSKDLNITCYEEASRRLITQLIHEIRSTLDWERVAKSTVIGLAQIFDLEECALWIPTQTNKSLQLCNTLSSSIPIGSTIPMNSPVINTIFRSTGAVRITRTCPLVRTVARRPQPPEAVAIRVPLLHVSLTQPGSRIDNSAVGYAVMVLVPRDSTRKFNENELELVEAVVEQVATALAHSSAIIESRMACDHLIKHNSSLELEVRDINKTLSDSSAWLSEIFHHMSTPMNAMTIISSLLLETELTPQQRAIAEALVSSSAGLETQLKNQRDLSKLENGTLELKSETFDVSAAFKQVIDMIKPIAAVKKISLSLVLASDLPVYGVGDQEKLMQIFLNVVGNAVKFSKDGRVLVTVSVAHPEPQRDWRPFKLFPVPTEDHFHLKVQVEDFGRGIDPQEVKKVFSRFKDPKIASNRTGNGLGLAISKRLLKLMGGRISVESEGSGKGCTATFMVKLGSCGKLGIWMKALNK